MTTDRPTRDPGEWVLLSYRIPREPSTPRIALWRKLKRLGVAQISDGLVALPSDARTREQLEWIADEAIEAGGTASIWIARPATHAQERELATTMAAARAAEYQAVIDQATQATGTAGAAPVVRRLRAELRRIDRRDFFPPLERDRAHAAVQALADKPGGTAGKAAPQTASHPENA
ncbi:Chromate resistance protein ChrB [Streptomyces sp. CA-142005]|uniref:Chromate resistance protein ChrB n=1 Tax=Streptomyces sp. CA-142005 TaxID=3240052 RepID=UPI003D8EB884